MVLSATQMVFLVNGYCQTSAMFGVYKVGKKQWPSLTSHHHM